MMPRCRLRPLLLLACGLLLACTVRAQVVHMAAGAGNLNAGEGASVGWLQPDATTTVGLGLASGVRVGLRREVNVGSASLVLGDSNLTLALPTDLDGGGRIVQARGLLLQQGDGGALLFAGVTGASYANAYVSTVTPSRFVSVAAMHAPLAGGTLSVLHTSGVRSNALLSWSMDRNTPGAARRFAATLGRSQGSSVFRLLGHIDDGRSRLDATLVLGRLQLQPVVAGQSAQLERVGLNAVVSRRLGQNWTVDAARHVYATADAANDPQFRGVTAASSQLLEAGTAFSLHALRLQGRLLRASSGSQRTLGSVAVAAWTTPMWSVQATHVRSQNSGVATQSGEQPGQTSAAAETQSSLQLQAAQQVHPRLRLEQTLNLGGNSNGFGAGGAWQGDRFSVSVTQRETFVPFGDNRGFHPVTVFGFRVRLGSTDTSAMVSRGRDLPATVLVSTESFYGSLGADAVPIAAATRMPRFAITGQVHDREGRPVRGAALLVGDQVVFTDSEGSFSHRLHHGQAVVVRLLPEQFVTVQRYRAVTQPLLVKPVAAESVPAVHLQVEACHTCAIEVPPSSSDSAPQPTTRQPGRLRALHTLWALARRMVARHPAAEQAA